MSFAGAYMAAGAAGLGSEEDYYEQAAAEAQAAAQSTLDTQALRNEWRKQRRVAMRNIRIPLRKLAGALDAQPINPASVGSYAGNLARDMAALVGVFGQDAALTAGGKPGSLHYKTAKQLYKRARGLLKRAIGKEPAFRASWAAEIHAFRIKAGLVSLILVSQLKPAADQKASKDDLIQDWVDQVDEYMAGSKTPAQREAQQAEISELRAQVAAMELAERTPPPPPQTQELVLPPVIADEPAMVERVVAHAEDNPLLWGAAALALVAGGYLVVKSRRGT
jgi:hypothetical protein